MLFALRLFAGGDGQQLFEEDFGRFLHVRALRQNGPVLWVRRPLSRLATRGRPLSKGGEALRQMEAERTPLYTAAATAELENNAALTEAVDKAVELFEADETL